MERALDNLIDEVKRLILIMGGSVEMALQEVTQAIATRNASKLKNIHQIEQKINEDHIKIDETCLTILAKQSPVAKDLRLILSVLEINTDLERMGDQTVNISYSGKDYLGRKPIQQLTDIQKMSEIAGRMVKGSLDCFVRGDFEQSRKILLMDDWNGWKQCHLPSTYG